VSRVKPANTKYKGNGVTISPAAPAKGDTARVVYSGLLAQNGANKLYVHVGFGDGWRKTADYRMVKTDQGFETDVPVALDATINMCFKDSADNWDNNSGQNYSFEVT
jgi:hypothetical protein